MNQAASNPGAKGPLTLLLCALGGEGGGVLSQWLYEVAVACGYSAQSTSIPGVAQRTGATTYYVEIHPQPDSQLAGRRPIFSLNPVPGAIDLLVSSELLETVRQIGNGMASAARTTVISSTSRALTVMEKMQPSDGRVDDQALLATLREHSAQAEVFDMATMARDSGTIISAVMFGAIAATGLLPFPRDAYEQVIRHSGRGVEASLRGFARAWDRVHAVREQQAAVWDAAQQALQAVAPALTPLVAAAAALPEPVRARFPVETHEMIGAGHARMLEYQDAKYAALYLERLDRVLDAERSSDPQGINGFAITRDMARYLALWMAFDDIVRVAELKLRASRIDRVKREVGVRDDELVKIYDHFKPGVPEFAALLPKGLATRLTRWDTRRTQAGKEPFALPLKLPTHTVFGALALRTLYMMKGQRRRGSRYALEQSLIERWLAGVERGAREHWALGHEIAECGRLIKGYGSTNERGKDNLLHVLDHLAVGASFETPAARAEAVHAARVAALADDAGKALDQTLRAHGAQPRTPREQPIRFYKRPIRPA